MLSACYNTGNKYIELEIGDKQGKKWISSNRCLHDSIPVALSPESPEKWRIEKCDNDALWSFHVLSPVDQKKLYVTYNTDYSDVTLEYEDDVTCNNGKGRLFSMLLHADYGMYFRANGSRDRYLHINGGKLEMLTTDTPTAEMEWLITPSFELLDSFTSSNTVKIKHNNTSQKLKSDGAVLDDPIELVQTSQEENWNMSTNSDSTREFSTGSLYVNDALNFGLSAAKFHTNYSGGGVTLKCKGNSKYVAAPSGNGEIYLTSTASGAASWDIESTSLIFAYEGNQIVFPYLPILPAKQHRMKK